MTEEKLEQRLRQLYHAAPAPDPQRLAAVLHHIEAAAPQSRHRPMLVRQRWLPWLLLACAVTAAAAGFRWYVDHSPYSAIEGHHSESVATPEKHATMVAPTTTPQQRKSEARGGTKSGPAQGRQGTVIYMR